MPEKYLVRKGMKWLGKTYSAGDPISHDEIMRGTPPNGDKLGSLLRTRMIELPPTRQLGDMNKDELIEHARSLGVNASSNWRVDTIIERIEEAPHGP